MSDLDRQIVLCLNSRWQPIAVKSIKSALVSLCSESDGEPPVLALDMEMDGDELLYANPTEWENWLNLPVREGDLFVQSARFKIRAPLVVVARNYDKMPVHRQRLSASGIYERDKGTCQYTGRKLPKSQLNLDHVVPRDKGGKDSWENLVLADKDLNSMKGNRYNHEVGLRLIRQPKAPPPLPVSAMIREAKHPSWKPFLLVKE